jgi:hypothetical protein
MELQVEAAVCKKTKKWLADRSGIDAVETEGKNTLQLTFKRTPAGFLVLESSFQLCDGTILLLDDPCSKLGKLADVGKLLTDVGKLDVGKLGAEHGVFVVVDIRGIVGSIAFDRRC